MFPVKAQHTEILKQLIIKPDWEGSQGPVRPACSSMLPPVQGNVDLPSQDPLRVARFPGMEKLCPDSIACHYSSGQWEKSLSGDGVM